MPLRSLKDIYEKRRSTLKSALERTYLSKERKAEINGAITEIDALIKTIDTLRRQEIEDNRLLEVKGSGSNVLNKTIETKIANHIPLLAKFNDKNRNRFDNSGTKNSLDEAFIKKCEARTRYEIFGNIAKEEGYESVAQIFYDTAANEREQARIILEFMKEDKDTAQNLRQAADMERANHEYYYTHYEKITTEEKYPAITEFFRELTQIDTEHEKRFLKLLKSFNESKVFRKDMLVKWRCKQCGYTVEAHDAPAKCKVCKGHKGKFEIYHEAF